MAKPADDTRASRWDKGKATLYYKDGKRVEFWELSQYEKDAVKKEEKSVHKAMIKRLKNITTQQIIDNNEKIEIHYTRAGLEHFCRSAMFTLSGKYFSRKSMLHVNEIVEKSTYVPTNHALVHQRTDSRNVWFRYKDNDGRGIYFQVARNDQNQGRYELYSVTDKKPPT